jgi:hypothetical protein
VLLLWPLPLFSLTSPAVAVSTQPSPTLAGMETTPYPDEAAANLLAASQPPERMMAMLSEAADSPPLGPAVGTAHASERGAGGAQEAGSCGDQPMAAEDREAAGAEGAELLDKMPLDTFQACQLYELLMKLVIGERALSGLTGLLLQPLMLSALLAAATH